MSNVRFCKNADCRFCFNKAFNYKIGAYGGTCAFKEVDLDKNGKCEEQEIKPIRDKQKINEELEKLIDRICPYVTD